MAQRLVFRITHAALKAVARADSFTLPCFSVVSQQSVLLSFVNAYVCESQLWAVTWVLGTEPGPLHVQPALTSFQP